MTTPGFPTKRSLRKPSEEHWVPLSDLMTGLMMMFMLVAVIFMIQIQAESEKTKRLKEIAEAQASKMKKIAFIYTDMRKQLYNQLYNAFKDDLPRWRAELDTDLAIRFKEPEVLFESQKAEIKPRFAEILSDFFPRYVNILNGPVYKSSIEEIRIEGHTSSVWIGSGSQDPYMLNMELSQARTRSVLQFVLRLPQVGDSQSWLKERLTANGLSSSKLVINKEDETENRDASRRVEFRVRTNADAQITKVLEASQR